MAEFHERKTYDVAHSNYHGKPIEEYACDTMQYDVKVGASKKNDCKCENEPKKQSNEVGEDKGLLTIKTFSLAIGSLLSDSKLSPLPSSKFAQR